MVQHGKTSYRRWRFVLGQLMSMVLLVGTCHADGQNVIASDNGSRVISISGDIAVSAIYSDSDYGTFTGYGTRLRLQLDLQPFRDLEFFTRLNTSYSDISDMPADGMTMVDRCYGSWSDIGTLPVRLSAGRLPTMGETSPGHLRLGLDQPQGWLSSFFDIALDGVAVEYRYQSSLPGQVRLYYATQIDAGYEGNNNESGLTDTTIYGLQWDIALNRSRSLQLQTLLVADLWNLKEGVTIVNPFEFASWNGEFYDPTAPTANLLLDRQNLGDIYQASITYLDKIQDLNYFVNLGWSHTNPSGLDELGTSLLGSWWEEPKNRDGFSVYAGLRYNLDRINSVGLEYNYGSQYWINFSQQGSDNAKLGTRGSVTEVYWTVRPPLPDALSGAGRSLVARMGYQYTDYEYTGSGFWLGDPIDMDLLKSDPVNLLFYNPSEWKNEIYLAVELYF